MSTDYTLGQPVTFTRHLRRRYEHMDDSAHEGRKVWSTEGYPGDPEPAPRPGIVIGVRTLADGVNAYNGYDVPIRFRPTRHFTAYLIAHHLRHKPLLVLPEHLTPAPATITVPKPRVPYGPEHLTEDEGTADYFREAARRISDQRWFGSNLSATLASYLRDTADRLSPRG